MDSPARIGTLSRLGQRVSRKDQEAGAGLFGVLGHAFNVITVKHLGRLLGGERMAEGPRLDWARLVRRTYGFDPLECPHCGERGRVGVRTYGDGHGHGVTAAHGSRARGSRSTGRERAQAQAQAQAQARGAAGAWADAWGWAGDA